MIPTLRPQWPSPTAGVGALSTLRTGGVSVGPWGDSNGVEGLNLGSHVGDNDAHVNENRQRLCRLLPSEPVWLTQVHGTSVVDAGRASRGVRADAGFTNRPDTVCAILTADCLPVLFADSLGQMVGAAHAGWRGLAGGVLENTVAAMRDAGADDIVAWLGPAIGPAHFEVGDDVRDVFVNSDPVCAEAFVARPGIAGKYFADLYALARRRLSRIGVAQVGGGDRCTFSEKRDFYSFRRDGVTGRMATLIWLQRH